RQGAAPAQGGHRIFQLQHHWPWQAAQLPEGQLRGGTGPADQGTGGVLVNGYGSVPCSLLPQRNNEWAGGRASGFEKSSWPAIRKMTVRMAPKLANLWCGAWRPRTI